MLSLRKRSGGTWRLGSAFSRRVGGVITTGFEEGETVEFLCYFCFPGWVGWDSGCTGFSVFAVLA